ncbi:reverse transcriptase domain-containing protein [Oleiagrimonas sp. MCCC 1A03011]|uniref:reverse transcriptase domain-containing protein n=1 Tax=Oleiagrimonas sp. MCCC 1A03011 TaxID=1926883 RepID=UPI000DC4300F|nr:reverse transcriptase domain-containing protein [Oleiagrimonas sp. MCCC 1A03011]RAP56446.1 hypothetical protein BTJ49_13655 [Oleiagrimonas sp. MCCC 1A03011]
MAVGKVTKVQIAFEILFSPEVLLQEYERKFSEVSTRGLDRMSGVQYGRHIYSEVDKISEKCLKGGYRFTPYLELLRLKGRNKPPRLISIPTIRDRLVLSQLNKIIQLICPKYAKSKLASAVVRDVARLVAKYSEDDVWVAGSDIKSFYDSMDRGRLLGLMNNLVSNNQIINLIHHAIDTPTVPKNYRVKDRKLYITEKGVPQGLAISNALASIYLHKVDDAMRELDVSYFRFVDDVLILGGEKETRKAQKSFAARVRARSLSVHTKGRKKQYHQPIASTFAYLGYVFKVPLVTVRESTVENLLQSFAAKISNYKHNKKQILERRKYLSEEIYRGVFIEELNEKISGAISKGRKYGWVSYFSEVTDHKIFHRVDNAIRAMFRRVDDLKSEVDSLKKFSRAYFEMRYRPYGGYVRNYDIITSPADMIKFLEYRGQISPDDNLTVKQIKDRFNNYRDRQLSDMLSDEGTQY